MAKKNASKRQDGGDTLSGIAESLGSLLGNAEKQWRAWQGPRDAVVQAVTDVRDRAVALLSEMGAAAETAAGKGAKKGKKKDKRDKKGKKARKAERAAAERAQAERVAAEKARAEAERAEAERAARPGRPAKKTRKKVAKKRKMGRKATAAAAALEGEPAEAGGRYEDALEAGDTSEF